ncbi:hypothetical protein K6H09_003955 [Candida tropicalis]
MNILITLSLFFITTAAQTNPNVEFLTRVVSDLASNGNEYISYFRNGGGPINLGIIRTAQQLTQDANGGDSYTTLAADSGFMSDLSAMITPLPWFNERIATGNISSVPTETNTAQTTSPSNDVNKVGITYVGFGVFAGIVFAMI